MSSTTALALIVGAGGAALVGLLAHLVGYDRDRPFYAAVLTVVGSLYVLFAVMAGGGPGLMPELAFFGTFAALAAIGFRTTLWIVALRFTARSILSATPSWLHLALPRGGPRSAALTTLWRLWAWVRC